MQDGNVNTPTQEANHPGPRTGNPSYYQQVIKDLLVKAESSSTAAISADKVNDTNACTMYKSVESVQQTQDKIAEALSEYNKINQRITCCISKDVVRFKDTVGKISKKYDTMINTDFKLVVQAIKDTKNKQKQVQELARKLSDAVSESCNGEEQTIINQALQKGGNDKSKSEPGKGRSDDEKKKALTEKVKEILRKAKALANKADDLSEWVVKVSAINTFINVGSLTPLADKVSITGAALIKDVEDNIKKLQTSHEDSRKKLGDAKEKQSDAMADKYYYGAEKTSWGVVVDFMKDEAWKPSTSLTEIAAAAEAEFNS